MFSDPTFWVLVAFVIFVGALSKPIARGAAAALDSRADKIRAQLDEAEKLREEAQNLLATYQRRQRDASKEADAIMGHATHEAERVTSQGTERLEAALKRREQLALERIAQAEAKAVKAVRDHAVDVAIDATRDVLARTLPERKADAMIDDAIRDLPGKLN